jgi:hypothetical protein
MIKYSRSNSSISGRLDNELVMMDIEAGKYFSLNPVATRIWELLENPRSLDELCLLLQKEYDVSEVRCRQETEACIKDLIGFGLVRESALNE